MDEDEFAGFREGMAGKFVPADRPPERTGPPIDQRVDRQPDRRQEFPQHRPRNGEAPHFWGHRERVRQRFEEGASGIPDYEMVEMILFNAVPRVDVKPLAKRLLADFGGFERLLSANRGELARHPMIDRKIVHQLKLGEAIAVRLARARVVDTPMLGGTDKVLAYLRTRMAHQRVEFTRVLYLDTQHRLIADEEHGRGTVNHAPAYPREIAKRALELAATGVILVHNHPSGDPTPSRADIRVTAQIKAALATINVTLYDHLIIGGDREISLAAEGLIE